MLPKIIDYHDILYDIYKSGIEANLACIPNTTTNYDAIDRFTGKYTDSIDIQKARDISGYESFIINLIAINPLLEKFKRPLAKLPEDKT